MAKEFMPIMLVCIALLAGLIGKTMILDQRVTKLQSKTEQITGLED